jgi:hypothetical protein
MGRVGLRVRRFCCVLFIYIFLYILNVMPCFVIMFQIILFYFICSFF